MPPRDLFLQFQRSSRIRRPQRGSGPHSLEMAAVSCDRCASGACRQTPGNAGGIYGRAVAEGPLMRWRILRHRPRLEAMIRPARTDPDKSTMQSSSRKARCWRNAAGRIAHCNRQGRRSTAIPDEGIDRRFGGLAEQRSVDWRGKVECRQSEHAVSSAQLMTPGGPSRRSGGSRGWCTVNQRQGPRHCECR